MYKAAYSRFYSFTQIGSSPVQPKRARILWLGAGSGGCFAMIAGVAQFQSQLTARAATRPSSKMAKKLPTAKAAAEATGHPPDRKCGRGGSCAGSCRAASFATASMMLAPAGSLANTRLLLEPTTNRPSSLSAYGTPCHSPVWRSNLLARLLGGIAQTGSSIEPTQVSPKSHTQPSLTSAACIHASRLQKM